jgi:aryl-alcohol dehydrogenase-like predicted oxidoreductase
MRTRHLRELGCSALGLGCMGMAGTYGSADEEEAIRAVVAAWDAGVTMFDTAEVYGPFTNEALLGRALAGRSAVVATKFGRLINDDGAVVGLDSSPSKIKAVADASLSRLRVDAIDLLYQHRIDPKVPIEEVAGAVADLISAGKVRHFGLCEVNAVTIRRANAVCPVTAVQSEYSLWERGVETSVLPVVRELGIGFVAYSPLGRGFLTGRSPRAEEAPPGDYRRFDPRFSAANFDANRAVVDALEQVAAELEATAAQVALAWLLAQGPDIVPIPGAKRTVHVIENAAADRIDLSADQIERLSLAVPVGWTSGARYPPEAMRTIEASDPAGGGAS